MLIFMVDSCRWQLMAQIDQHRAVGLHADGNMRWTAVGPQLLYDENYVSAAE